MKDRISFTAGQVDYYLQVALSKEILSITDKYLYQALETFPLSGAQVAVLHSKCPQYEALTLSCGAQPTTISPHVIENKDPRLTIETSPKENSFDAALMLLHLKSVGLGSPLEVDADFDLMNQAKRLLKKTGLLYLSLPVGKDRIFSHSHRIYGAERMKRLFKGWRPAGYFGYSYEDLLKDSDDLHEPVIVLKPIYNHSTSMAPQKTVFKAF